MSGFTITIDSVPRSIPSGITLIPVNTVSSIKTFNLPVASTNIGRLIIFKDNLGNSAECPIFISTIGLDRIDRTTANSMVLSNTYGAWTFVNDGISMWNVTNIYNNTLVPFLLVLSVLPTARYSFLSTNYPGSGNVSNIGSNISIGAATTVVASYSTVSPSFVSLGNYVPHYILAPSVTDIQTLVLIARIKTGNVGYMLDARPALGNGWIFTTGGSIGTDWTTAGIYYKDTVLTSMASAGSDQSTDNQWHHFVYQRAAWTGAVTFLARHSLNESAFSDCAEIMIFTQALTFAQVINNFNFFAPRFGWTPVPVPTYTFPATVLVLLQASSYSGSGTWSDQGPSGRNATLENGSISKNTAGNGIVLNGSTNWIFNDVNAGNAWTMSAWYKNTGSPVGSYPCIVTQIYIGAQINICLGFAVVQGFSFHVPGWFNGTPITITNSNWTYYTGTWNGTTLTTYINGVSQGSTTPGGTASTAGSQYRIGRRWDYTDYMVGEIGEVRIYNASITGPQVLTDYNFTRGTYGV